MSAPASTSTGLKHSTLSWSGGPTLPECQLHWGQHHEVEAPVLQIVKERSLTKVLKALSRLQASFDLQNGPMWCAACVQMPRHADRVVLAFHHLVMDAVSWRIFEDDLAHAY